MSLVIKRNVPVDSIERHIHVVRGQKVMLDSDLAALYQVQTFNLNKAVKRNSERFPEHFMFQLNKEEAANLRFQKWDVKLGRPAYAALRLHGTRQRFSVRPRCVQLLTKR